MSSVVEYPKRMVHPAYKKSDPKPVPGTEIYKANGEIKTAQYRGDPDRFPPVDVSNSDQEEQYRAKGYLPYGETAMNVVPFQKYPMMMTHPDYEPATETIIEERDANGKLVRPAIPGTVAKYGPVTVTSAEEEERWTSRGYELPGKSDPDAVQASISAPYVPGRTTSEYPKWVDGKMVEDPNIPIGPQEYPKWITINGHPEGGKVVRNRSEEIALVGDAPDDKAAKAAAKKAAALKAQEEATKLLAEAEAELEDGQEVDPEVDERATLLAEAEEQEIKVDKRWSTEKIRNAVKGTKAA